MPSRSRQRGPTPVRYRRPGVGRPEQDGYSGRVSIFVSPFTLYTQNDLQTYSAKIQTQAVRMMGSASATAPTGFVQRDI
jgi:hypothetical protein